MGLISDLISAGVIIRNNIVNNAADAGIKIVGDVANFVQNLLQPTIFNTILSYANNWIHATIAQVTNYNPAFLQNDIVIAEPKDQDLSKTPTVSEFMQAAVAAYDYKAIPDGATPFLYGDKQLGIVDTITGMAAKVWVTAENQVIISYQGTTGGFTGITNPIAAVTQVLQDVSIASKSVTAGEKGALKFAQFVVGEAEKRGYTTNDIFVTGHSLGAIEAQYVAQQTGLGGIGFNGTGIPVSDLGKGHGDNFVNVLQYGDPVSNYASDIEGEQPFAPAYDPTGGELPHYGQKVIIGSINDQNWLSNVAVNNWGHGSVVGKIEAASKLLIEGFLKYHLPWTAAKNLGIDLGLKTFGILNGETVNYPIPSAYAALNGIGTALTPNNGAVLNLGNSTIQQFLALDSQRTDYHSSALSA